MPSPHINAEKVFINNSVALEKMRTGEIAGVVHVTGKPTDLFTKFKPEPGFHFLPVQYTPNLQDCYVPTELTSKDIPIFFSLAKPWTRSRCSKSWRSIIGLRRPIGIAASPARGIFLQAVRPVQTPAVPSQMERGQSSLFASRLDPVSGRRRIAGGNPSAGIGQSDQAAVRRVGQKQWPPIERRRVQAPVRGIP